MEINWEEPWSPLYGNPITIPENTILWRSYDKSYPAIGDRFSYYSSQVVATGYKTNTRELGCFLTTKPLKVLDIRFMKPLLSRLIQTNLPDKTLNYFIALIISFGLCSLRHQIELVKLRYETLLTSSTNNTNSKYIKKAIKELENYYKPDSLIEQVGVRIAETTNDMYTMGFLQELFKAEFDGFISPRLQSPFHIEKKDKSMSPELILFNPKESKIKQINYKSITNPIKTITINELIYADHNGHIILENIKLNNYESDIKMDFYMCGGHYQKIKRHYLDEGDELLNSNDKETIKYFNEGREAGNKWRKKIKLFTIESPVRTIPISLFSKSTVL